MADILHDSVLWRVLQAIVDWLTELAGSSGVFGFFRRCLQSSWLYSFLARRLTAQKNAAAQTRSARLLENGNAFLGRRYKLRSAIENSLFCRIWRAIVRCGRGSEFFGWLFDGGFTTVLLTCSALYVVIDYAVRDVLAVPVLSSAWDEGLLLLCLLWVIWQRIGQKPALASRANPLDLPVLLFMVTALVLSAVVDPYPGIQLSGLRATIQYMVWFFLITRLLRDERDVMKLYVLFVAMATAIALHGIYQYIVGVEMPSNWVAQAETAVRTRVYSIFGSPNIMGCFMVMFIPLAAALAYYSRDLRLQLLAWVCAGLMGVACLFTMSRGAWAAMAVAVVIFIVLVDLRLLWLLLVGGLCMLFVPFVRTRIGFLFTEDFVAANTNGGRGGRKLVAMTLLHRRNPAFGVGLGMFGGAVAMQNQVLDWQQYFYVDNYYLKILVEMGYVGLAAFIAELLGLVITAFHSLGGTYRAWKQKRDRAYPLIAGMFSGLCGVLVHCSAENIFEEPYMMVYFWTLAAMIVWLGYLRNEKAESLNSEIKA